MQLSLPSGERQEGKFSLLMPRPELCHLKGSGSPTRFLKRGLRYKWKCGALARNPHGKMLKMYVYTHARILTHTHIYICACTHMHPCTCIHTCTRCIHACTYTHAYTHVYTHNRNHIWQTYTCIKEKLTGKVLE